MNMSSLAPAFPALVAFPLFLGVHLTLWQVLPRNRKGVLFLVISAAVAYVAVCALGIPPLAAHVFTSLPLFAFLVVFYMHLYFGIDRSLSIRMCGELAQSPSGVLTMAELDAVYSARDMVARRLEVLVEKGLLARRDGIYACTPRGQFIVRLALLGKRIYALDATG
jgi:hypothetical protein